jgi:ketosteroid isomerase-like protein
MRACLLLAIFAVAAPNLTAQEWSPQQQEVLAWLDGIDWIDSYARIATSFDIYHPDFVVWHYPDEAPQGREAVTDWFTEWAADHTSVEMELEPLAVQVVGDLAILHLVYREEATTKAGTAEKFAGRWTATAVKDAGAWRFLTWTWLQTEPWPFGGKE